jgi:uncharacterized phage protein gp47/JayE
MYEEKTFENILSDMLSYVSDQNPDLDTRTGSLIYNALAPIALELESAYHEMDMILNETFMETASKEYLIKHGNQIGVEINAATHGHFKGEFNVDVPIGSRFNLDEYNYNVINKLTEPTEDYPYYTCELVCETAGAEPNGYLGDLTPITFISNISHAKLVSVLIYGEDEEDTEAYRYRLQVHVKQPPINGNVYQYNEWLAEYDGVGKYRTIPCWNGVNTVKLLISNSENKGASEELVSQVQAFFDPPTDVINDDVNDLNYPQGRGMGNGQAPIGAIVTVDTITEVPVVVNCRVVLKEGYNSPVGVQDAVDDYLNALALNKTTISYMAISAEIFNAESVADIANLTISIDGKVMDINRTPFVPSVTIEDDEVAVLDIENSTWEV